MIQPWPKIIEHYEHHADDCRSMRGLAVLVRFVGESQLARGLFGWTSMHDLCVVQTEVTYPYDGPKLVVSPLTTDQIEFRYVDTLEKAKQWHSVVDPDRAVPRLLKFLDQLRWFPAESLNALRRLGQGSAS